MLSIENKTFVKSLAVLSLPIMIQMFISNLVNFSDLWMMGQLDLTSVTAVGLSNRLYFLLAIFAFGINSGTAVFMGQFWGKGDKAGLHKSMGIAIILNLTLAIIFASIAFFIPHRFLGLVTQDAAVVEQAVAYLRVMALSYFITIITYTLVTALRAIKQPKVSLLASGIALVVKISLNILFIFVLDLGIVGAAWGTVIARIVELIVNVIAIRRLRLPIFAHPRAYFAQDAAFMRQYIKVCLPVVANEFTWGLGVFLYDVAYQFAGSDAQGAIQITDNLGMLFGIMGISVGSASAVLISNALGAGDRDGAIKISRKCLLSGICVAGFMCIMLLISGPLILSTYNITPEVRHMAQMNLFILAPMLIVRIANFMIIISVLRSGGDTLYCLIIDLTTVWLVGIPLAFLGARFLGLPIYLVLALVQLEEVSKLFFNVARYKKMRWANTLV